MTPEEAAQEGLSVSACPYRPGSPEGRDWTRRWTELAAASMGARGQFGATPEQKSAVGLSTVPTRFGVGHFDHVHEIWGGPSPASDYRPSSLASYIQGLIDALFASPPINAPRGGIKWVIPPSWGVDTSVPSVEEMKAEALARKRRPFVCRRHGKQAGAFCRMCERGRR